MRQANLSALPDYFNADPKVLKRDIMLAGAELDRMRQALAEKQRACQHKWSDTKYDPIVHEGYQDHGDPPGTMGVDRRLPSWIPRLEIPVWKRACSECGMEQETRSTRDDVKKVPVFHG